MNKVLYIFALTLTLIMPHSCALADSGEPYSTYVPLNTWWVILILVGAAVGTISLAIYLILSKINRKNKK